MDMKDIFKKSKSVKVEEDKSGKTVIHITRKSRFIRKDAQNLLTKCQKVQTAPGNIILKIDAPLCSKAKVFLEEKGFHFFNS